MNKKIVSFKKYILIALALVFSAHGAFAAAAEKEWTLLVFLNGHNNLDPYGAEDINEMEKVGSSDQVNVVVQWASEQTTAVKRLYVTKDDDSSTVTSKTVQELQNVDMGDWHALVDFANWAKQNYPAKHYFVDIWDHGTGWHGAGKGRVRPLDISYDEGTGHIMTTNDLGQALKEISTSFGQKIDIYGSDACLMAMIEISSEIQAAVSVHVGSQETEPGAGWPYDKFLARWEAKPTASAGEVGTMLVEEYVKSYQGGSQGSEEVTFSAMDLSKHDAVISAFKAFSQRISILSADDKQKVANAISKSQAFYLRDYRDLNHFLTNIDAAGLSDLSVKALSGDLKAARDQYVITHKETSTYANASGVSLWLPSDISTYNQYSSYYKSLIFEQDTHWGLALESLLK